MRYFRFTSLSLIFALGLLIGGAMSTSVFALTKGSSIFVDVSSHAFYDDAVGELAALGIIKGMDSTHFNPDVPVTRGEVAVLLKRMRDEMRGTSSYVSTSSRSSSRVSSSSSSAVTSSAASSAYAVPGPQGTLRFTTANYTVAKTAGSIRIMVVRVGGTQGSATVDYSMAGMTAVAGTDFTPVTGTLTFSGNSTSQVVNVPILGGASPDTTFAMTLSNPTGGAVLSAPSTTTITILKDENSTVSTGTSTSAAANPAGTFVFSAVEYGAAENGSAMTVTVNRLGGSLGAATINYATSNATAMSGSDYSATNGTLAFAAGETSKTFTVAVIDNRNYDGNRYFNLSLSGVTGGAAVGTPSSAKATIIDDEVTTFSTGSLHFSSKTFTVKNQQGNALVMVSHVGGIGPVSVSYSTNGGSALPGVDYTASSGTLSFASGEVTKYFFVPILNNPLLTGSRDINVLLTNPTVGATLFDPSSAVLTLQPAGS